MHIQKAVQVIKQDLISWRRDFHKHAEVGFLEMRTASIVASYLEKLGYVVKVGEEVMKKDACMGIPSEETLKTHREWALKNGADKQWIDKMNEGLTGVVGIVETGRPGPVIAYRVDMDALNIQEDLTANHRPFNEGFVSVNKHMMHACGHDGHTAIGLGLSTLLMDNKELLCGTIKIIFQPAEEGTRGAKSMVEKGIVDDVDFFIATHIGLGIPLGEIVTGQNGFLATTKIDASFKGKAAHAGSSPEIGKNALMAAATAVLGLHSIPRHSKGDSRVNVGFLQGGSGRNIIPSQATMQIETRGETTEINDYMYKKATSIVRGAAEMYDTNVIVDVVGSAPSGSTSPVLVELLTNVAEKSPYVQKVSHDNDDSIGSEDATYFMNHVQSLGGLATYTVIGTSLSAGHHNEKFDFDEEVLPTAVDVLFRSALKLVNLEIM